MNEFAMASDADFAVLQSRCQDQCAIFPARRLPPRCSREQARVGVESIDGGTVNLLIDQGISYSGDNGRLKALFRDGKLEFSDFSELKFFLRSDLGCEFGLVPNGIFSRFGDDVATPVVPSPTHRALTPDASGGMTDFDRIEEHLDRPKEKTVIDASVLAQALKQRVIGQDSAIEVLAGMAARQVNRSQPRRPASVFMIGTTGVGKTKAAMALAECLGEQGAPFTYLRLDMSEYQEQHRVSQLLGAPQGYLGHDEGAQLTNFLAESSKCVVLLDEMEKAHLDVFKALLSVFDTGRISSPKAINGKYEIDCKETIFVVTSNLAADALLAAVDEAPSTQNIDALCRKHLTNQRILPELVGRIGAFCLFRPLKPAQRARILTMAIAMVAREYGVEVEYVAPDVVIRLLDESDSSFGARPDEQTVDRIFGETFAQARSNGVQSLRLLTYPTDLCVA